MRMNENKITKRCTRFFGAWQAEKEEQWLNSLAQQGWLLTDVSSMVYRFRRIEPKNWVYQLDFVEVVQGDFLDYEQLFADAGWEYVTTLTNWHYFRADGDTNPQRIHTDVQSKIAVFKRVRRMLLLAGLPSLTSLWYMPMIMITGRVGRNIIPFLVGLNLLVLAALALVGYSLFRVNREIKRLEEIGQE